METTIAESILTFFKGRVDNCAIQASGSTQFRRLEHGISSDDYVTKHLAGTVCYGFYLMLEDNTVHCSCVDFDNHEDNPDPAWRDKAEKTYYFLSELGFSPVVEISSSGNGAHVWLFFEQSIPSWLIRKFWKAVDTKLQIGYKEIYPRQDRLSGKGVGSLVRLPYWNESKFVNPEDDWESVDFTDPRYTSRSEVEEACIKLGASIVNEDDTVDDGDIPHEVAALLTITNSKFSRLWNRIPEPNFNGDTSTSAWAFYIAEELVYRRIHPDVIKRALKYWCLIEGYAKGEREDWLDTVINGAYDSINHRHKPKKVAAETLVDCAKIFLRKVGNNYHFESGIPALDYSIQGLGLGEVGIVAARPGHCKSALALQWLIHQSMEGVNCLMLNAEMSANEIGRRIVMQNCAKDEEYWQENKDGIATSIEDMWEGKGSVFYKPVGSIDDVEENIKNYVEQKNVQLVAVDYLQLLRSSTSNGRYETVTEISQRIKGAARDHDVAILALCQVSREVEKRDTVEFQGSDLRESGQLEQDADLIIFGWNHGKTPNSDNPKRYDIHIAKRRNGPIKKDRVYVVFESSEQRFYG